MSGSERDDSGPWRGAPGDSGQGTGPRGPGQGTGPQRTGQGTGPQRTGQGSGPQSGRGPDGRYPADRAPRESERGTGASRRGPAGGGAGEPDIPETRGGIGGPTFTAANAGGGDRFGRPGDWGGRGAGGSSGAGSGRGTGSARVPAGEAAALGGLRAGPALRWMGTWPAQVAIYIVLAATLLGILGTVVTGNEPGFLLGFLIFIGSVIATLGVRRSALYVVFPLPALANFIGAVAAGAIHDRGIDTSTTELGASFLQWIANVFFAMCATTIIVLVIAGARWLLARQLVSGQFAMSADRRPGGSGPRPAAEPGRRPDRGQRPGDRDPWAAVDPWADRAGNGGQRLTRDQRDSRDPWGDRRRPADRAGDGGQPGTGPQPGGTNPPGGRSQPGGGTAPSRTQPGGRTQPASTTPPGGRGQPGGAPAPGNRTPGGGTAPGGTFPPGTRNQGGGNRGLPPDRNPRGPRDPWDDQDPRDTRGRRSTRDQRDSRNPWGQR
jgi:hypothetical protein